MVSLTLETLYTPLWFKPGVYTCTCTCMSSQRQYTFLEYFLILVYTAKANLLSNARNWINGWYSSVAMCGVR